MPRQSNSTENGSSLKLRQKIYEEIRRAIITCELAPGSPLSEASIAERYQVSKTPVREALTSLQQYHLVEYTPNRGFNVTHVTLKDIQEIFEARAFYEVALFRLALRHLTPAELAQLKALAQVHCDRNDPQSITHYIQVNYEFHMAIAAASRNTRLIYHYSDLMDEAQRLVYMDMRNQFLLLDWHGSHQQILEALQNRDEDAGARIIEEMLDSGKKRILGLEGIS